MANLYTDHDNKINVVAHQNLFSQDGNSYYGRVIRNTVTLEQLVKGILDDNQNTSTGLNAYILSFAMDRMKARILTEIKSGNAVSLLGLGTMYLGLKGSFTLDAGSTDVSALKGRDLTVAFTPSEETQNAVSHLKVGSVSLGLSGPAVNGVVNLARKKEDWTAVPGKGMELKGRRLKLEGEGSGIFFVPADGNDAPDADESTWKKVSDEDILKNYPKSLIFQVPQTLPEGKYVIAVRTAYCGGNTRLKSPVTGYSMAVSVTG